jgi:hypothetical protein
MWRPEGRRDELSGRSRIPAREVIWGYGGNRDVAARADEMVSNLINGGALCEGVLWFGGGISTAYGLIGLRSDRGAYLRGRRKIDPFGSRTESMDARSSDEPRAYRVRTLLRRSPQIAG